jgi:hypothetical protein
MEKIIKEKCSKIFFRRSEYNIKFIVNIFFGFLSAVELKILYRNSQFEK